MAGRFAIATWIPGYQRAWLPADLLAGVSVAAVALPIAIAYAQLAGVPPVYGIYSSLLPLVVYALLGSSRQLIVAPDAATCAIVAAVVVPLAGADLGRSLALTAALSLFTGVFCILAGLARLGFLTNFLARPILIGYLNGIAISIIVGQLGGLFGFPLKSSGVFRMLGQFATGLGETHLPTLAVGAATLLVLIVLGRVAPRVPGPLVAVVGGIGAAVILPLAAHGVRLLGPIPPGLPYPALPAIGATDWSPLALGAIGLALISYNSAMVTARGFAAKNRYDIDPNREFIALGVSDLGSGALGGFAVSGADSRTAVNDAMGGKSPLTSLVAAAALAATLVFLTGPLAALPMAVLSAVLIKAAMGLLDLRSLVHLRRVSPREFVLSLVAFLGVATIGVLPGVVLAIGLALVQLIAAASRPHDAILGRDPESGEYRDVTQHAGAQPVPGLVLFRYDAALLFFNADHFKARVRAVVGSAPAGVRSLVLDAGTMPQLDSTGAACLEEVRDELESKGIALAVAAARSPVRGMLERTGLAAKLGPDRMFATVALAVDALRR